MITARVQTPAKINLGLEIPGKREDGYHDIVTILCMVDLVDTLTVFADPSRSGTSIDGVPADQNLVTRALAAFSKGMNVPPLFGWTLDKRIPAAAGLGGASSNAAGALLAANALSGNPLATADLRAIANTLGSDIAFFLGEPVALATGTGTDLAPLNSIETDLLLIVPKQTIGNKTAALYGALRPEDFSDGSTVLNGARALESGHPLGQWHLTNAFLRSLRTLVPAAREVHAVLSDRSELNWGLSGAGPSFYVLAPTSAHEDLVSRVKNECSADLDFVSTTTRNRPLSVHLTEATETR